MATDESELTERQRDVLRLHRAGKNPTEIGRELGVSSQGIHAHLRRLRAHGLVDEPARKPGRSTTRAKPTSPPNDRFDPKSTIAVVVRTITAQLDELNAREAAIDAEITALNEEKAEIGNARTELQKLVPEN